MALPAIPPPPPIPPLVARALALADELRFANSCTREVGHLLATLAAAPTAGRVAESGTGCGVGSAWIASGLGPRARLFTVERDPLRAARAEAVLAEDDRVRVLHGDWRLLAEQGPFDLFFCDGGGKREDPDGVVAMLAAGGILVLDDFTPGTGWPPRYDGEVDWLRLAYLTHPLLRAVELAVAPDQGVVVATRR